MCFENKIIKYYRNLYGFAIKLTKNETEAEDLLQNTYLKILNSKHLYKESGNMLSWMMGTMKNLFIDSVRRKKNYKFIDTKVNKQTPPEIFNILEVKYTKTLLKKLNPKQKSIMGMVSVGYKYKEIAEYLSTTINDVKSNIFRARKELSKYYEKDNNTK